MTNASLSVTCIGSEETQSAVTAARSAHAWIAGGSDLGVASGGLDEAMALFAAESIPGILFVETTDVLDFSDAVASLCRACGENVRVVIIGTVNDVDRYRAALENGAFDYLVRPLSIEKICQVFSRAETSLTRHSSAKPARDSRRIVFIGARGGIGTTTLALGCAWILAEERKQRICLIDLDLHYGTFALALDAEGGHGFKDGLIRPERIDSLLVTAAVTEVTERLSLLSAEESIAQIVMPPAAGIEAFSTAITERTDAILYEMPRHADAGGRATLTTADAVVITTDLSLAGLRDAVRIDAMAKSLSPAERHVVAVQTGAPHRGEVTSKTFEEELGFRLAAQVPFDPKACRAAAESGAALPAAASKSKAAIAMRQISDLLMPSPTKPSGKISLARRLSSWRHR